MNCDNLLGTMPYGDLWRAHRRMFHPYVNPAAVSQWEYVQRREVHSLLRRLVADPSGMATHVRLCVLAPSYVQWWYLDTEHAAMVSH